MVPDIFLFQKGNTSAIIIRVKDVFIFKQSWTSSIHDEDFHLAFIIPRGFYSTTDMKA